MIAGSCAPQIIDRILPADVSVTNSVAYSDLVGMGVAMNPGEVWDIDGTVWCTGLGDATLAGDILMSATVPAGATTMITWMGMSPTTAGGLTSINQAVGNGINQGTLASGSYNQIEIRGRVTCGTTAGTWQPRFTQAAANATPTTVKAGSYVKARRVQ
jgi:hypothetical protein